MNDMSPGCHKDWSTRTSINTSKGDRSSNRGRPEQPWPIVSTTMRQGTMPQAHNEAGIAHGKMIQKNDGVNPQMTHAGLAKKRINNSHRQQDHNEEQRLLAAETGCLLHSNRKASSKRTAHCNPRKGRTRLRLSNAPMTAAMQENKALICEANPMPGTMVCTSTLAPKTLQHFHKCATMNCRRLHTRSLLATCKIHETTHTHTHTPSLNTCFLELEWAILITPLEQS